MSTWRGSIFGFHRAWVAPAPRTLNWFQEAVVYAHGDSVNLQRFVAGAKSGNTSVMTGNHSFDGQAFGEQNAKINGTSAAEMIQAARSSVNAAELAGLNDDNVLVPLEAVAAYRAKAKGDHVSIIVVTTGGDKHTIWITSKMPLLGKSMDILHQLAPAEQIELEKITYRPARPKAS